MNRRGFLFGGTTTLLAAPAIVRVASLMSLSVLPGSDWPDVLEFLAEPATVEFTLSAARINRFKGLILRHAVPLEVLGRSGRTLPVIERRWLPYG